MLCIRPDYFYGTIDLSFVIPRACDFFDLFKPPGFVGV
jgi:hypothetical protein